ncbi:MULTISPECIES: hypothetical protein [Cyanophyceae]|uniref:hypothetical protein n=1 Tax=Cyanophyceae TaxID=3028117 RepID=UPI00168236EA|nr:MULTISPECIES: hypothetical protein [Cyanophyceae]MBD1917436.1 hypothetical protein [Phormidium sp. FACHB-77]MBD2032319.1 hypothetical protein [Phormidium sp. FACHB-322]MBD2052257.1 hypothetical protein [Leptolyngbya sp. FACHB-60]
MAVTIRAVIDGVYYSQGQEGGETELFISFNKASKSVDITSVSEDFNLEVDTADLLEALRISGALEDQPTTAEEIPD